jgi:hypothetical protein
MKTSLNKIVCPYCEEDQGPFVTEDKISEAFAHCSECEKVFFIVGHASWTYTTKKIEGEE